MKPNITPQQYKSILESLELDTLFLVELNSKFQEELISSGLELNIDEKSTFEQVNNLLNVTYLYKLIAKDKSKEGNAISITAKFQVRYKITKDVIISKGFMNIFVDLTLGMLLWPFFRELVNNMVNRMGMPPLVLPLKKK